MQKIKRLFGDIELSWTKIIIFAIVSGVYTALVCIIPALNNTSFHTIAVTFEVWILFGIFIIMNSKSNLDSALKCFVFFLISQPLVYLLQVPFSSLGWGLFGYYKRWFIWTVLCLPMGYIGYYIKKDKWWGYIILLPMIVLTAGSYRSYLADFIYCYPFYILITIFCLAMMFLYPYVLFNNKKIKIVGVAISGILAIVFSVIVFLNPIRYPAELMSTVDDQDVTEEYQVYLADDKYGDVYIKYIDSIDTYCITAEFKKSGKTELIVNTPDGTVKKYDLDIGLFTYDINEK